MNKVFLLLLSSFLFASAIIENSDKVTSLHGFPSDMGGLSMYSGYLNTTSGRMFYMFIESIETPSTAPLVLWLNGGPGCSSLLGLFQEIGPYVLCDDCTEFQKNDYTWQKSANILFLESPLGVGFSYSNDTSFVYDDFTTAHKLFEALQDFYVRYPMYRNSDFWITGESYAGVYIPFFASHILNKTQEFEIKLKGLMIGNGVMISNSSSMSKNFIDFMILRGTISSEVGNIVKSVCIQDSNAPSCQVALRTIDETLSRVNPYDIYGYCYYADKPPAIDRQRIVYPTPLGQFLGAALNDNKAKSDSPCVQSYELIKWLRNPDVLKDLHVDTVASAKWNDCWTGKDYKIHVNGSIWLYPQLFNASLKILLYSGDADAVVSLIDTQRSIEQLNLEIVKEWHSWYYLGEDAANQIGGYATKYNNLTLATVRGAGHMVPQWRRKQAYQMFSTFLRGEDL